MATGATVPTESDLSFRKLRIAAVCLMGQTFGTSIIALGALTLLMLPMTSEFGWTRTQFSYANSAIMWFGALTGPVLGRIADRWGVRPVILTGTAMVGLATLALSRQTSHLWQFYLCFALLGIFGSSMGAYARVIGALFTKNRGKAFAIMMALMVMISSMMPQITNLLLTRWGWRGVFGGFGSLIVVVFVILYFALEDPGAPGKAQGPVPAGADAAPGWKPPVLEGMTAAQALRDRTFWTLAGAGMLAGALGSGWMQHQVAYLTVGRGFTQQTVVNILSLAMLVSPVIALLGGWLVDRVQSARIGAPFALLAGVGFFLQWIIWANRGGQPVLFVGLFLGFIPITAQMPMAQYFYTRYFGMKAFAEIYGIYMGILALVMGFASPFIGMLFERTGSYNVALILMMAGTVAAALLMLTLRRYRYSVNFAAMPKPEAEDGKAVVAAAGPVAD